MPARRKGAGVHASQNSVFTVTKIRMTRHELHKILFERFDQQWVSQGCRACKGQIIDASFVDVPRQRNSREENAQIKAVETPERLCAAYIASFIYLQRVSYLILFNL